MRSLFIRSSTNYYLHKDWKDVNKEETNPWTRTRNVQKVVEILREKKRLLVLGGGGKT